MQSYKRLFKVSSRSTLFTGSFQRFFSNYQKQKRLINLNKVVELYNNVSKNSFKVACKHRATSKIPNFMNYYSLLKFRFRNKYLFHSRNFAP